MRLVNVVPNGGFEVDASGWPLVTSCTIARSTLQANQGTASLAGTSTGTVGWQVNTAQGTSGFRLQPGPTLSVTAWLRAATTGRSCTIGFDWWNAAGTKIGSAGGSAVTDVTTGWTAVSGSGTIPALTAFGSVWMAVASLVSAEVHYMDSVVVMGPAPAPVPVLQAVNRSAVW